MNYLISEEKLKSLDKNFNENNYEKCFMGICETDLESFLENYKVTLTEKERKRFYKIADKFGSDFYDGDRAEEVITDIIKMFLLQSKHSSNGTKILQKIFFR